jgi:ZIP family zinc transporter
MAVTNEWLWVAGGTRFIFLMTSLGSMMVFVFRKTVGKSIQKVFLSFAAGVMIAASMWGTACPRHRTAEVQGQPAVVPPPFTGEGWNGSGD